MALSEETRPRSPLPHRAPTRPPYSSISAELLADVPESGPQVHGDFEESCGQSHSVTFERFGNYSVAESDSVAVLGTGATADLALF